MPRPYEYDPNVLCFILVFFGIILIALIFEMCAKNVIEEEDLPNIETKTWQNIKLIRRKYAYNKRTGRNNK